MISLALDLYSHEHNIMADCAALEAFFRHLYVKAPSSHLPTEATPPSAPHQNLLHSLTRDDLKASLAISKHAHLTSYNVDKRSIQRIHISGSWSVVYFDRPQERPTQLPECKFPSERTMQWLGVTRSSVPNSVDYINISIYQYIVSPLILSVDMAKLPHIASYTLL